MPENVFMEKEIVPTANLLAKQLGQNIDYLVLIQKYVNEKYGEGKEEWKFYNKKSGWIMKFLLKKRNLFFLVVKHGFFSITFVFGDRAVEAILKGDIDEQIKNDLKNARKYMEGRGITIDVHTDADLDIVLKLLDYKMS